MRAARRCRSAAVALRPASASAIASCRSAAVISIAWLGTVRKYSALNQHALGSYQAPSRATAWSWTHRRLASTNVPSVIWRIPTALDAGA